MEAAASQTGVTKLQGSIQADNENSRYVVTGSLIVAGRLIDSLTLEPFHRPDDPPVKPTNAFHDNSLPSIKSLLFREYFPLAVAKSITIVPFLPERNAAADQSRISFEPPQ